MQTNTRLALYGRERSHLTPAQNRRVGRKIRHQTRQVARYVPTEKRGAERATWSQGRRKWMVDEFGQLWTRETHDLEGNRIKRPTRWEYNLWLGHGNPVVLARRWLELRRLSDYHDFKITPVEKTS